MRAQHYWKESEMISCIILLKQRRTTTQNVQFSTRWYLQPNEYRKICCPLSTIFKVQGQAAKVPKWLQRGYFLWAKNVSQPITAMSLGTGSFHTFLAWIKVLQGPSHSNIAFPLLKHGMMKHIHILGMEDGAIRVAGMAASLICLYDCEGRAENWDCSSCPYRSLWQRCDILCRLSNVTVWSPIVPLNNQGVAPAIVERNFSDFGEEEFGSCASWCRV